MDNEDHACEYQQGVTPPHSLSPLLVNHSSAANVPVAPQGETSENDFYVPSSVPRFNTSSSPGISLPIPLPENHAVLGGSSLMLPNDSQPDPVGFTEVPPHTTGMHAWTSQPHLHGPSFDSTLRPRSQTNPSFFPSGPLCAPSHPATHGLDSQMIPGNLGQTPSLARRTSPSTTFHPHLLPAQFASGPLLHTHPNSFPGQYVMSSHAPPFHNQPSQPHMYYGHPPESSPYPPTRYFPLPGHQPLPYFQHRSSVERSSPSYHQTQRLPPAMSHSATSNPRPSHAGSYGTQQFVPPPYRSTGHFGLPQQYQPNVYPWYFGPGLPPNTFNNGVPMQVQHHPMNYSRPEIQRPRRDSDKLRAQSTDSERSPSPTSLGPSSKPIVVTTSRNTISPVAADPPEQISVRSSTKTDTRQLSNKSAASTLRTPDRSPIRRHYHPNPPPNRSEWVMWVGNVPSGTTHDELGRFLKYFAPASPGSENNGGVLDSGVISIFLISRSNCAFVNYQSEEHLNHAVAQFNGRKLRPHDRRCPRLVCRARRKEDDLRAGVGAQRGIGVHTQYVKNTLQNVNESMAEKTIFPKGRRSNPSTISGPPLAPSTSRDEDTFKSDTVEGANPKVPDQSPSSYTSSTSSFLVRHFPKRFFILKSLTQYDLDLSVERGVWATQKHNEAILDQAFRTSKEVILIFSVNKSGEFYGYAQMASGILRSSYSIPWAPRAGSSPSASSQSSSCMHARGTPEQLQSPSQQSPRTHTSPSEPPLVPSPDEMETSPSVASSPKAKFAEERRSAPPVLHRDSEDPIRPDPLLRSSFSCSHRGWPVTAQLPQHPDILLPLRPGLGKNPGIRAGARSMGGVDDPGNSGLHLQSVTEEAHSESNVEGDIQPASTVIPSIAIHDHSEAQQREENWGETFKVKWLCTRRVPFRRTRHLRNPWNHGREIKVSRDGTEVEPAVGQQLVEEWPTLASEAVDDDRRTAGQTSMLRNRLQRLDLQGNQGTPRNNLHDDAD